MPPHFGTRNARVLTAFALKFLRCKKINIWLIHWSCKFTIFRIGYNKKRLFRRFIQNKFQGRTVRYTSAEPIFDVIRQYRQIVWLYVIIQYFVRINVFRLAKRERVEIAVQKWLSFDRETHIFRDLIDDSTKVFYLKQ